MLSPKRLIKLLRLLLSTVLGCANNALLVKLILKSLCSTKEE